MQIYEWNVYYTNEWTTNLVKNSLLSVLIFQLQLFSKNKLFIVKNHWENGLPQVFVDLQEVIQDLK